MRFRNLTSALMIAIFSSTAFSQVAERTSVAAANAVEGSRLAQSLPVMDRSQWASVLTNLSRLSPAERTRELARMQEGVTAASRLLSEQERIYDLAKEEMNSRRQPFVVASVATASLGLLTLMTGLSDQMGPIKRGSFSLTLLAALAFAGYSGWEYQRLQLSQDELDLRRRDVATAAAALVAATEFINFAQAYFENEKP